MHSIIKNGKSRRKYLFLNSYFRGMALSCRPKKKLKRMMKQMPYHYKTGFTLKKRELHCLECGDPLPYGSRTDRKFCSEKCRHDFHNERRAQIQGIHLRVCNAIDKNYRILHFLLDRGSTGATMTELLMMGFRPEYMTSCSRESRFVECRCYEISYRLSAARLFKLKTIPVELLIEAPPEEEFGEVPVV